MRIRPTGVSWREVDGEVIALDLDTSAYFSTNRSGTALWRVLVDGASRGDLVTTLSTTFGVSGGDAGRDVDAFIGLLDEHGLLEHDR